MGRKLPKKESNMQVMINGRGRSKIGMVDDLMGILSKNLVCNSISNMFSNSHHVAKGFA